MAKRKVKLNEMDLAEQADAKALDSNFESGIATGKEDKYQGSSDALSALNDLIKSGNTHLNSVDLDSFLKADDAGKKAMIEELAKAQKKRRINLGNIGEPQGL